jgi:hypothetical protein
MIDDYLAQFGQASAPAQPRATVRVRNLLEEPPRLHVDDALDSFAEPPRSRRTEHRTHESKARLVRQSGDKRGPPPDGVERRAARAKSRTRIHDPPAPAGPRAGGRDIPYQLGAPRQNVRPCTRLLQQSSCLER